MQRLVLTLLASTVIIGAAWEAQGKTAADSTRKH
jgi:hypothetical protein